MTPNLPDWTAFDPSSGTPPDALTSDAAGVPASGLVTFLADQGVDRGWATDTVLGVVRAWAGAGRKVFLADLNLREPVLHEALGVENADGISDVFLFGASVRHVSQPVEGGFLLATAGTPVSDPASVLRSDRWDAVLGGFRDAGALLVVYVSAGTPGMDALLGHSDGLVHMSQPDAPALRVEGGVLARIGPGAAPVVPAAAEPPAVETPPALAVEEPGADEVVDVASLAPDAEPLAPPPSEPIEEVVDVGALAPEPAPEETVGEVIDVGALAPDSSEEEPAAPEAEMPEVAEPEASEFDLPASEEAEVEEPVFRAPAFEPPSTEEPELEAPVFDAPDAEEPEVEAPVFDAPDAEEPEPEPEPEAPMFEAPVLEEPEPETPAFEAPEASEALESAAEEATDDFGLPEPEEEPVSVTEEDDGAFDLGDLPAADEAVDDAGGGEGGELFSMDALEGTQYGVGGQSEAAPAPTDAEEPLVEESDDAGDDFDMGDGGLEVEAMEPEAPEESSFELEGGLEVEEPTPSDEPDPSFEMEGGLEVEEPEETGLPSLEVEGSALVDDDDLDSIAASSSMMDGIETGSGFEMPDDDEPSEVQRADFGGPEFGGDDPAVEESGEDTDSGGFDFGDEPIELESEPGPEEPDAIHASGGGGDDGDDDLAVTSAADELLDPEAEDEEAPFLDPEDAEPESAGAEAPAVGDAGGEGEEGAASKRDDGSMRVTEERELTGLAKLEKAQKAQARARTVFTAIVAVLVLGGLGYGAAYMGVVPIAGITPPERMGTSGLEPVALPGPVPTTAVMSHALITQLYNDIESPWDLARSASANLASALFYVAPVAEGDRMRWGLFVGPAYSAVEAEALRAPVDSAIGGGRFDETDWRVVDGTYAFFFGEYPTAGEAQSRVDGLLGQEIPTYILQVDYADGAAYRVYGGAYGDPFQAAPFLELLQERDLTDIPLIERRGEPPE